MKLIHISDLHLGKHLYGFSLLEDQSYILDRILETVSYESPDAVIIAGDIYDRPVPPAEAVKLFDDFVVRLSAMDIQVFIISGNHDNAMRLAFGGRLMDRSGVHFSPEYDGNVMPFSVSDEFGTVDIYMLPFIKPQAAARYFLDEDISSYTDCLRAAIEHMPVETGHRKVLAAHQFVTGAERSDSEEVNVGGLDNVDACVFRQFDYVALGHIHRPQNVGGERIRYCGTPLKYSFSEADQDKSLTVVELGRPCAGGAEINVRTAELVPLRDMKEIKGKYSELTSLDYHRMLSKEDYYHVTLTDENDILDALGRLRTIYKNIMCLDYDNTRTRSLQDFELKAQEKEISPLEYFADFYEQMNGSPMSGEQREVCGGLIQKIWNEEESGGETR